MKKQTLAIAADQNSGFEQYRRRMLETRELGAELFLQVNRELEARGLRVGTGTIVDATIIAAPSSTKNVDKAGTRRCIGPARASSGTFG